MRAIDVAELTSPPTVAYNVGELVLAAGLEPAPNAEGGYALLTVRSGDGLRVWVLDHDHQGHLAWHGPSLLDRLPGPPLSDSAGDEKLRLGGLPGAGLHLDVAARTAGFWTGDTCPGLSDELAARWPGWAVSFWGDDYERHLAAAGGQVVVPPYDEALALAGLAKSLSADRQSPLAWFAGMVERERAAGRNVEVNPAAWSHTDTEPADADRLRLAQALARLSGAAGVTPPHGDAGAGGRA